jgi:hypothetical protein
LIGLAELGLVLYLVCEFEPPCGLLPTTVHPSGTFLLNQLFELINRMIDNRVCGSTQLGTNSTVRGPRQPGPRIPVHTSSMTPTDKGRGRDSIRIWRYSIATASAPVVIES